MRNTFRAYYAPSDPELEELWSDGTIVLDANTLLNFFRYTPGTRDEFLRILEELRDSLWIPHQVGLEFHQRRIDVIHSTSQAFPKLKASIETAKNAVTKTLNEYRHHPSLNRLEVATDLDDLFQSFSAKVDQQQRVHEEQGAGADHPDHIFDRISDLFLDRVGEGFTSEDYAKICEEGEDRYANKIPPGFRDAGKQNGNQYGDLIIWKEILRLGEVRECPLIFVTDDAKDDWWWIERGETQGPRVELVDEYWAASGKRVHFYEPLQFIRYAKERTQLPVSEDSLEEVREVSDPRDRVLRLLRERREALLRQRDAQLETLEHYRSRSLTSGEQEEIHTELESVIHEQQYLEAGMLHAMAEIDTMRKRAVETSDDAVNGENFNHATAQMDHYHELRRRFEAITHRRDILEHRARRSPNNQERMISAMARKIHGLDEELSEVTLALDELGG